MFQTSRVLVEMEPCNSHALLLLGDTLLTLYESEADPGKGVELLEDAKRSYLASITMEGKKATGKPPEDLVRK